MSLSRKPIYKSNQQKQQQQQNQTTGFNAFRNKRFYCGNTEKLTKDTCCFNHIVGLPISEKTGLTNPLYDYECIILNNIFYLKDDKDPKNRHVWVKKATGLGITELILRLMLWLCVRDNRYRNSQMCIVTGPSIEIATGLIQRMKGIFERIGIYIENKETVLQVNGVIIKAFPSNHLSTYRGLTSPAFIFLDEGDFFKLSDIQDVRDTTERYITKSKPYIVMVSTPNKPDLLFQMIEREPEDKCIYRRLFFNYEWGIGKMFTQEEIDIQKFSPSFDREYDLKYAGKIGNVFSELSIQKATALGEQLKHLPINQYTHHFGGIDPGWAKTTPVYIGELLKEEQCVRIIHYEGFIKSTPEAVADYVFNISKSYINLWWFVDGADRGFINTLKTRFGERQDWMPGKEDEVLSINNRILPVNFTKHHKSLLEHTFMLVSGGKIAIPKEYDELITALRTCQAVEWNMDKENSVNDDHMDSFRLMLKEAYFGKKI